MDTLSREMKGWLQKEMKGWLQTEMNRWMQDANKKLNQTKSDIEGKFERLVDLIERRE